MTLGINRIIGLESVAIGGSASAASGPIWTRDRIGLEPLDLIAGFGHQSAP